MNSKQIAAVKKKIMAEAKKMAGSDRVTQADIELAKRKLIKPVKKALGGEIAKGAKKLSMKIKTKLNERRMKKQLDKLGYDPDAVSGPNTLSKIIEREAKKNRKAEGGIARGGRAAIRGIKFTGVK